MCNSHLFSCMDYSCSTVAPLYSGHHWGMKFLSFIEEWPYLRTKRVHLGLSKVAFIEGCPHVGGGGVAFKRGVLTFFEQ